MQKEFIEFAASNGDIIRFTSGDGEVIEEVYSATANRWKQMGTAQRIHYDPRTRQVRDQSGQGGVIPQGEDVGLIVRRLAEVCDSSKVSHNIQIMKICKKSKMSVKFEAPSGDNIKLTATSSGVKQQLLTKKGWMHVGRATHLRYNPTTRALVNQNNQGGILPIHNLSHLLEKIILVADTADVTHNICEPQSKQLSKKNSKTPPISTLPSSDVMLKTLLICKPTENEQKHSTSWNACTAAVDYVNSIANSTIRKVTNVVTKTTIELGLEWLCEGNYPGDNLVVVAVGCLDSIMSPSDWHHYFAKVPRGCNVTIVCDGSTHVLSLPHRYQSNSRKVSSSVVSSHFCEFKCSVTQLVIKSCSRVGLFTKCLLEIITRMCCNIETLIDMCCRSVESQIDSYFNIVFSSKQPIDIINDTLSFIGDGYDVVLSTTDAESVSVTSSLSEGDVDKELLTALYKVYSKHSPTKTYRADKLISEYRGRYRQLFKMLSIKYNDPQIQRLYSSSWGL